MAVGRITGPLLKANLLRHGVDLAFETNLLYLDVTNGKVGIKTIPDPQYDLDVNGNVRSSTLEVATQADIATFTISGNTVASSLGTINLEPSGTNAVVYQGKIVTGDLQISTNTIEVTANDTDLAINTLGIGKVNVNASMYVDGDLHVTGNLQVDGDAAGTITIGDSNTDNVEFKADVNSNIIPDDNNTWDLGSDPTSPTNGQAWRNLYTHTLVSTNLSVDNLTVTTDLTVAGTSTFNGDVNVGNASSDVVTFNSTISSNLIPTTDQFYDLGSNSNRWDVGYFNRVEIDGLVIDNNQISTTIGNDDLILTAAGSGTISIPSNNVLLDQNLTVTGATDLQATTINGDLTQTGNVTQTGDYTQTGNSDITGNLTVSSFAQFEKIRIEHNVISITETDTDLKLEAAGTGKIYVPADNVLINYDLTVDGIGSFGLLNVDTSVTAGSFNTGDILIENNSITTQLTNSNLELKADGTGIISIPNNDVEIAQDLTVDGNFTVTTGTTYLKDTTVLGNITQTGDIDQTGNFTTSGIIEVTGNITATADLTVADITISGHTIEGTAVDTDINLLPNGTGDIVFEDIRVTNNIFKSTGTNEDIILQPQGSGSVLISSDQSLIIPVGTDAQRPASPVNGMIRYNTDRDRYEGYYAASNKWVQLSGVIDEDGNTYVTAELAPGTNDNIIRFVINSDLLAYIDATKLWTSRFETNDIAIYDNQITTVNTDTNIDFTTSGSGAVKIGNLKIRNNTITNTVSGAVTEFAETGSGYLKITGTAGVVIPSGDLSTLPLVPETGMIRFNTYYSYVEVFNGTTWVNSAGTNSGITLTQAQDIGIVSALLFG
jgi:hypothetical protein